MSGGFFTFQCFVFFLIFAFSCLCFFSSFPLLLDFLKPKSGPSNEVYRQKHSKIHSNHCKHSIKQEKWKGMFLLQPTFAKILFAKIGFWYFGGIFWTNLSSKSIKTNYKNRGFVEIDITILLGGLVFFGRASSLRTKPSLFLLFSFLFFLFVLFVFCLFWGVLRINYSVPLSFSLACLSLSLYISVSLIFFVYFSPFPCLFFVCLLVWGLVFVAVFLCVCFMKWTLGFVFLTLFLCFCFMKWTTSKYSIRKVSFINPACFCFRRTTTPDP